MQKYIDIFAIPVTFPHRIGAGKEKNTSSFITKTRLPHMVNIIATDKEILWPADVSS